VRLDKLSEVLVFAEAALRIGVYAIFAIGFVYMLVKKPSADKDSRVKYMLAFFAISVPLTFFLIMASFWYGHSPRHQFFTWYLLAMLTAMVTDKDIVKTKLYRIVSFSVIGLLCAVSFYNHNWIAVQSYKTAKPPEKAVMAQYMLDNGYDVVLARDFWNANIMGGYTDLQLKTAQFDDNLTPRYWLVDTRIFDSEDGKYALIFSDEELANFQKSASGKSQFILQQAAFDKKFGKLNIYSLNFNPFRSENIKDYSYTVKPDSKGMAIHKSAAIGADGALYSDGANATILWGPYAKVSPYVFDFKLNYEVVENASDSDVVGWFDVCTQSGKNRIQRVNLPASETSVSINGVVFANMDEKYEHRVGAQNGAKLKIISIEVTVKVPQ
jgi:hypothetical protein